MTRYYDELNIHGQTQHSKWRFIWKLQKWPNLSSRVCYDIHSPSLPSLAAAANPLANLWLTSLLYLVVWRKDQPVWPNNNKVKQCKSPPSGGRYREVAWLFSRQKVHLRKLCTQLWDECQYLKEHLVWFNKVLFYCSLKVIMQSKKVLLWVIL